MQVGEKNDFAKIRSVNVHLSKPFRPIHPPIRPQTVNDLTEVVILVILLSTFQFA